MIANTFVSGRAPLSTAQTSRAAIAPKSHHVAQDGAIGAVDSAFRAASPGPNPAEGTAEEPQIGDQRVGGVGGNGTDADGPWGKDEGEAHEGHAGRRRSRAGH